MDLTWRSKTVFAKAVDLGTGPEPDVQGAPVDVAVEMIEIAGAAILREGIAGPADASLKVAGIMA